MARSKRRASDKVTRSDASQQDGRPVQNLTPGGATNQVLAKASAADGDAAWVTLAASVPPTRQIISGAGLTGGGDLSADRTLAVGAGTGITVNADDVALDTASSRNVDHAAVSVIAGAGLTGGGTIAADRTVNIGAGVGITVNADDIAVNYGATAITACVGNDARLSDARTPTAHNILSASHGDTLAAAVARGSLIVGNATPKWSALAVGAATYVVKSDGSDAAWGQVALSELSDTIIAAPAADQILKYNGVAWVNAASTTVNGGAGVDFYPDDTASDIATYAVLNRGPENVAETDISAVANGGRTLIKAYASPVAGLGGTQVDPGEWIFDVYAYVNLISLGTSSIDIDVLTRTSGGVETLRFNVNSGALSAAIELYSISTIQQAIAIAATDRLVVKVYAKTTAVVNRTCHLIYGGSAHYSNLSTPLVTRHNDLAGLQGGAGGAYHHLPAPTRGQIAYATATPAWAGLGIGAAARVLRSDGADPSWAQVVLTTDVTGLLPYANMVNATAASVLVGRGAAAGAGVLQEVTLGANLTMTGTVLSATGGVPGGSTTQVQFDDAGAFGGDANFTWDKTNHRLGVGATAPLSPIHISSSDGTIRTLRLETADAAAAGNAARIDLIRERGTLSAKTVVSNGDVLGTIAFVGYGGVSNDAGAYIAAYVSAAPGSADMPTTLAFYTSADGSATPTNRLTIDHTGLVSLLSGQLSFPATQNASSDANTLDDYEEGTWTPVIGGAGGTSGQTYSTQVGRYTKIGRAVTIEANVSLSAKGTITGQVEIHGLPFSAGVISGVNVSIFGTMGTNWVYLAGTLSGTAATMYGFAAAAAGGTALLAADISNNTAWYFNFTYSV